MKKSSKVFFIIACACAGLSLGVGMGFAVTGLLRIIGLMYVSIGTLFSLVVFALSVMLIAFIGLGAHRKDLNAKTTAPYFAKPTKVKDLAHAATFARKYRHAKVMVVSYFDPKEEEKGGAFYQANINSLIESYFQEKTLYFMAPNRFVFFALKEEEPGYFELFEGLHRKLKKRDASLRLYIGLSKDEVGADFESAYQQANAALIDRFGIKESLSVVRYEELEETSSALAGLEPIERIYENEQGERCRIYPFGYHGLPAPLSFLGGLGLGEAYENASLGLAKEKLAENQGLVGIYFSPTSFHASSFYLSLNYVKSKKRLIVFLPAFAEAAKLAYAAKKIKRMGCLVGYYGVDASTPLSHLDLEGGYLLIEESFYEEEPSIVKAKKNLFSARGAILLGKRKEHRYHLHSEEGGAQ